MRTFVVGCNHRTAPLALRERLAFDDARCAAALRRFGELFPTAEAALLSTCNRTELYVMRPVRAAPRLEQAVQFLAEQQGLPAHEFSESLYHYEEAEAVRHLFRVVSSLDSMVVGESGILAQAKHALELARLHACSNGTPRRLDALFQKAFSAAKQVHTQTGVAAGRFSVGSIAVDFARQVFSRFDDKVVLMIGAGKMGELTVKHLLETQPRRTIVTNRTAARAAELAARLGAEACPYEDLIDLVTSSDIVLSCTGSPEPILTRSACAQVPERRRYRPLLMIDLAVPRDLDPAMGELPGFFVYNIDDLQRVTEQHAAERRTKIADAEQVIEDAVIDYLNWVGKREVGPVIRTLNARFEELARAELEWLDPKMKEASPHDRDLVRQMLHRLIGKMLHEPTRTLHAKSQAGLAQVYAETVRTLFALSHEEEEPPTSETPAPGASPTQPDDPGVRKSARAEARGSDAVEDATTAPPDSAAPAPVAPAQDQW